MHVLSNDRNIHELIQYFSFFHETLSNTPETASLGAHLHDVLGKLKTHREKSEEAERQQLIMRAKMNVSIFFLRKAVISLGKEIRKAELAIKSVKFYEELLPEPPPGNQIPLPEQLQKFKEMIETALANFHKIPDHPKCEPVRQQRETLEYWVRQAQSVLAESRQLSQNIEWMRRDFREIQMASQSEAKKLYKELLPVFDYNQPDVNQYFLTLSF